ncbi:hypothetical protein RUND412_004943 [Rhizina undulata]
MEQLAIAMERGTEVHTLHNAGVDENMHWMRRELSVGSVEMQHFKSNSAQLYSSTSSTDVWSLTIQGGWCSKKIDGSIVDDYVVVDGIDPLPWMKRGGDHSRCLDMSDWLHKDVRHSVINRIRSLIVNLWPDTHLRVFGSYAAGLYIPTFNVDLVVISRSCAEHGMPKYYGRKHLMKLAGILRKSNLSKLGSVQVILKAKVPIVKFVYAVTVLKVDVSFGNQSVLIANQTFGKWKTKFPAMPLLVVVIKHFQAMRGLNEVYLGGLVSFSVTCLFVSLLQILPSVASWKIDPSLHHSLMLLQFFELYGNKFNTHSVGIHVDDDPGYFPKKDVFPLMEGDRGGYQRNPLCIQHPNNYENDRSKPNGIEAAQWTERIGSHCGRKLRFHREAATLSEANISQNHL